MPIIIHRQDGPTPDPANDWDKAAGIVIMAAASLLLLNDLFVGGLLLAAVHYFEPQLSSVPKAELVEAKNVLALFIVHGALFGLANVIVGLGIFQKARWSFYVAPALNGVALTLAFVLLGDESTEFIVLAVGVAGYGLARLFGSLGPKP